MKNASKMLIALTFLFIGVKTVNAQNSLRDDKAMKAKEVKGFVDSKDFVFEATHHALNKGETPLRYHKYDVAISKDTLIAYLPGHSGPVKFDCTNFAYSKWRSQNGDWNVVVKPNDNMTDVKQIKMNITPQGHAMVHVIRSNAGPLAFDGYIKQEDY